MTLFLGSVGGGFRVQLGNSFAVRAEVRDLVYTARVDRVDGCNLSDFEKMEEIRARAVPLGLAPEVTVADPGPAKVFDAAIYGRGAMTLMRPSGKRAMLVSCSSVRTMCSRFFSSGFQNAVSLIQQACFNTRSLKP